METIALQWSEVTHAANAGVMRWIRAQADGRELQTGRNDLGLETHIRGAIAEYAVARFFNRCWSPAVGFRDHQIGDIPGVQVKSVLRINDSLVVQTYDEDKFPFVLVILIFADKTATAFLAGWIGGKEAKQQEWLRKKGEPGIYCTAYFVPQNKLRAMTELCSTT